MSVRTDVVNLEVTVGGDKAKHQLNELRKEAARLNSEMKGFHGNSKEYKKREAELEGVKKQMAALRKEMGLAALSEKELVSELNKLKQMKRVVTPQTKEFFELQKQIDNVNKRLKDVRNGTFGWKAMWGGINREIRQFGVLAAGYLGFNFITDQAKNIIRAQKIMSDEKADIIKTTGLSADEVNRLNEELKELDTRTSNSGLRKLAYEAGKLGNEGAEDVKKFIDEANKIDVALGEDLGDEAIIKISKTAKIFKEGMLNMASGINSVGQASEASESFLVDFTFKTAGTAQAARIAAGDILGFAAALDIQGQTVEVSSTALNNFFLDFIAGTEKFGMAAGMAHGELTNLVNNKGTNEAFLQWLQRMKDSSANTQDFVNKMKALGIDGVRGANILLALSNNIDLVREQQALANEEIAKGTSIIDEYNIKNNNFAATVDKLSKDFNSFVTSSEFRAIVTSSVHFIQKLLEILPPVLRWIKENLLALSLYTAAIIMNTTGGGKMVAMLRSLIAALSLKRAQTILSTAAENAALLSTAALSAAKALLAGNIKKAAQELKAMLVFMRINPYAALLAVIGTLVLAYNLLSDKTKKLNVEQRVQLELSGKVEAATGAQIAKVNSLVKAINSQNISEAARNKLIKQLIDMNPELLSGLDAINIKHREGKEILDKYITALKDAAYEEAINAKRTELYQKKIDAESSIENSENAWSSKNSFQKWWYSSMNKMTGGSFGGGALMKRNNAYMELFDIEMELHELDKRSEHFYTSQAERQAQEQKGNQQIAGTLQTISQLKDEISQLEDEYYNKIDRNDKAALAANKQRRKELEKEIAKYEDSPKRGSGRKGERSEQRLEDIMQKLQDVREELIAGGSSKDEAAIQKAINKYESYVREGMEAIADMANLSAKARAELQENLKNSAAYAQLLELQQITNKQFTERSESEYDKSVANLSSYYQSRREEVQKQFIAGKLSRLEYMQAMEQIEREEIATRLQLAKDYEHNVDKAAKDAEAAKTEALEKGIADREALEDKEYQDRINRAKRKLFGTGRGTFDELQAKQELLKAEFDFETAFLDKKSELYLTKEAELNDNLKTLNQDFWREKVRFAADAMQQVGDMVASAINSDINRDAKRLEKERQNNEIKKNSYKILLAEKLINQRDYEAKVAALEAEMAEKQRAQELQIAKRRKAVALMSAIVNTGAGIARAFADYGWPMNMFVAAMVGAAGAIQVGNIEDADVPTGRRGMVLRGPSHEQEGIDLVERRSGRRIGNAEGGEPVFVFSRQTYANNKGIVDELLYNSMYNNGARINAGWYDAQPSPINTGRIIPLISNGGTAQGAEHNFSAASANAMQHIQATQLEMLEVMKRWQTNFKVYMTYRDLEETEDLLKKAKSVAGVNQQNNAA